MIQPWLIYSQNLQRVICIRDMPVFFVFCFFCTRQKQIMFHMGLSLKLMWSFMTFVRAVIIMFILV